MRFVSQSTSRRLLGIASASALAASLMLAPSLVSAQAAAAAPAPQVTAPVVGDMAPDFTISAVTAAGPDAKPFRLADHKGETVVLAFFPKARTSGCTVQMESYRDQYATLFNGGKKVTLLSISTDVPADLVAWATDAKFPFTFGSDVDKAVGTKYGAATAGGHRRLLYVIGPDGKITYAVSFKAMAAEAYTDMGAAIKTAAGIK